jgi:hypothetical protein
MGTISAIIHRVVVRGKPMASGMARIPKLQNRGVTRDVPVRLFWPAEEEAAWDCRWEIEWPDGLRANSGRGV